MEVHQPHKLLDRLRQAIHFRHLSRKTEKPRHGGEKFLCLRQAYANAPTSSLLPVSCCLFPLKPPPNLAPNPEAFPYPLAHGQSPTIAKFPRRGDRTTGLRTA